MHRLLLSLLILSLNGCRPREGMVFSYSSPKVTYKISAKPASIFVGDTVKFSVTTTSSLSSTLVSLGKTDYKLTVKKKNSVNAPIDLQQSSFTPTQAGEYIVSAKMKHNEADAFLTISVQNRKVVTEDSKGESVGKASKYDQQTKTKLTTLRKYVQQTKKMSQAVLRKLKEQIKQAMVFYLRLCSNLTRQFTTFPRR